MKRLFVAALLVLAAAGCAPATSPAPAAAAPGVTETTKVPARPTRVRIPSQHVDVSIIDLGLQSNGEMQVPPDAKDAGWYVNSPIPGQVGPSVLAAHIDWKGVDGPFRHLDQLKPGDEVMVENAEGAELTFVIDRIDSVLKNAFPTDRIYADTPDPELVMITCGGSYDAAAHSYRSNIIARAKLKT